MKKYRLKSLIIIMAVIITMFGFSMITYADSNTEVPKPAKVTGLNQTEATTTSVHLSWDSQVSGPRYEIYASNDGKTYTKIEETASSAYTICYLSPGKTYYVKVIAVNAKYLEDLNRVYADEYSDVLKVSTLPSTVTDLKQTAATTDSITLSWKASKGATGYYVRLYEGSSVKDVAKVKKNTATIKNMSKYSNYKIKIVPYITTASGEFVSNDTYAPVIWQADLRLKPKKMNGDFWIDEYRIDDRNMVYLEWNRPAMSDACQVQAFKYNGKKTVYSFTETSPYISYTYVHNIKNNSFYKIRMRGYSVINGKKVYGSWSSYLYFAGQPDVELKAGKKSLTASWDKVSGADSYTVYVSTKQKSGYKKVATTKKTSYKIIKYGSKKLSSNKKYYVYVVANKKVGKTTYKSNVEKCWYLKTK